MKFSKFLSAFTLLSLVFYSTFAQKPIPELWGQRVHDEARVLKQATIDQLEKGLEQYEMVNL